MIFECPHCSQSLEVDNAGAGQTIHCPTCGQPLIIPDASASPEPASVAVEQSTLPRPPMHVPLQPLAPGASKPLVKKRIHFGCGSFLLLVLLSAATAFAFVMHRSKESPQQSWDRLTMIVRELIHRQAITEPAPSPEETAQSTPRPDPVTWLVNHKQYWPKEVSLREAVEFPAVSGGQVAGALKVPAGSVVKVIEITEHDIAADFMGGRRRVAISATDLSVRAEAAMSKAEADATQNRNPTLVRASPTNEQAVETVREAGGDEVRTALGAVYTRTATTFRIFAPSAKAVSVVLYNAPSGADGRRVYAMKQQSNNLWDTTVRGDWGGKFYTLQIEGNDPKGVREVLDPYAVNSVSNSSRGRITPMTNPVPRGSLLLSATDAIIYEMHVRDFTVAPSSGVTNAGLYLGWTEAGTTLPDDNNVHTALDHLSELGVTHVELMPVQDFENDETSGSYNWGYITSAFFSPEGMFATAPDNNSRLRELKSLITALHARRISVIMDVVYNHTSGNSSLLTIGPHYYYRQSPNGSPANGSGCGNEFKTESPMGRRLIIDSLKFWAKEYGIDGFRFDLMALIDQETIRQADRELRKINPSIVLFGEPWTGGASPLRDKTDKQAIRQVPAGAFNDDFRNALKGSPDREDPGWIQNGSKRDALKAAMLVSEWCASPAQSINYMTCHDNLVLWDKLVHSMPNATDALRIETMKLGYLALFTSQGVPFIHGGEEFGRTKGGNNNSFEAPDAVNEVDWNLKRQHMDLFNFVRDVIALRKLHPLFRLRTRADVRSRVQFIDPPDHAALMFTISGEGVAGETWKRACVVLNSADEKDSEISLPGGEWLLALDENGATAEPRAAPGKISVRHKSGAVFYQQ